MFDTESLPVYEVTAAYTSVDERLFPGWVLLKDQDGTINAKVRSARVLMIRRADIDPTRTPRPAARSAPQVTITTTTPGGPPSPAAMAALREHAAKAARV